MKRLTSRVSSVYWFTGGIGALLISTGIGIYIPIIVKNLFNNFLGHNKFINNVYVLAVLMMLNIVVLSIGNGILEFVGEKSTYLLRDSLITKSINSSLGLNLDQDDVETASHITNDSEVLGKLISTTIPSIVTSVITWIGSITMLIVINVNMTLIILLGAALIGVIIRIIGGKLSLIAVKFRKEIAALNAELSQLLKFKVDMLINDSKDWFANKGREENYLAYKTSLQGVKYKVILMPTINGILLSLLIMISGFGLYEVKNGFLTTGALVSFVMYLYQLITPTLTLSAAIGDFSSEIGSLSKVREIEEIFDRNQESLAVGEPLSIPPRHIQLNHVDISYGNQGILKDVVGNFEVGKSAVIVGASGSGKTTLINVMLKLISTKSGNIIVNNQNLENINLNSWYSHIGYVSQVPLIVEGSISDNLQLGAHLREESMIEQLKNVGLWEELKGKNGLECTVGNGTSLSGGQIQRLAIARAILNSQDILVLDEATSALDDKSEKIIIDLLERLKSKYIIIQISHKDKVIQSADTVLNVEDFKQQFIE